MILILAGVALVAAGATLLAHARDMRALRDRLTAGSRLVQTRHGPIEVASWGEGPPVLVIHGAGGGYDQGLALARAIGGEGLRWISPSRFGYLRTPLPADPSTAAQADAFADLLDSLGLARIPILAMSGGVPPALQFAVRHPERTAGLALLAPAPYTPFALADQKLPVPGWVYQALFASDLPLWLLRRVPGIHLERMFDVTPALRERLTPDERALVSEMMDAFHPVTWRFEGLRNEGIALDPRTRYPLDEIAAPALVVHARDDGVNPFAIGEHTARHIRGARWLPLASGGHLLLGHQAEVQASVNAFLRRCADADRP